jgi:hypothetical protein
MHALSRPHAHSILGNPIEYTFRFCPGREEAAGAHTKRYGGCARSTLPGQGPPKARPTPRLEASSRLPCFAFPFQHANTEASRTPPPPLGGRQIHPNKVDQIHPNSRYVQACFFSDTRITRWSQNRTKPYLLLEAIQFFCITRYQIVLLFLYCYSY